jgi:hypothetical protein
VPESFERIQEGMTLAEVEAILGGPPRDYTGGSMVPIIILSNTSAWADSRMWVGDEMAIDVALDDSGRIFLKEARPVLPARDGSWDRLRRLLPW